MLRSSGGLVDNMPDYLSGIARSIYCFFCLSSEILSPYDLVGGGMLNPSSRSLTLQHADLVCTIATTGNKKRCMRDCQIPD